MYLNMLVPCFVCCSSDSSRLRCGVAAIFVALRLLHPRLPTTIDGIIKALQVYSTVVEAA